MSGKRYLKKPDWLKVKIPSGREFSNVFRLLDEYGLSTVCQEARCPNMHECWNKKSATIMILGRTCTRACRFCAVQTGNPRGIVDDDEPERVAEVINRLGLRYVVITSVDRDDLEDSGSVHYARTVKCIKTRSRSVRVEALIPDFRGRPQCIKAVVDVQPTVIGHNIETVRRLTPAVRDRRCGYDISLGVLKQVKSLDNKVYTKSGFMVGLGETPEEIGDALVDLQRTGVDIVTVGQYLQPTAKHHPVIKYYTPEEFSEFEKIGKTAGIPYVVSGPLVRSSYHAAEIVP